MLRAIDAGQKQATVAKTFSVSTATIKRYLKQRRETGHVRPRAFAADTLSLRVALGLVVVLSQCAAASTRVVGGSKQAEKAHAEASALISACMSILFKLRASETRSLKAKEIS